MNPSSNEAAGMNLPPAGGEQSPAPEPNQETSVQPAEQISATPEQAPQAPAQPPIPAPAIPLPITPNGQDDQQVVNTDDVSTTTKVASSKLIEDTDLIEKEWVDKAKQIVARNRDDPHKQSEELTEFRADYMKKTYNKTIKIDK